MLNKRHFIRDTNFDEEIVNVGGKIEEIRKNEFKDFKNYHKCLQVIFKRSVIIKVCNLMTNVTQFSLNVQKKFKHELFTKEVEKDQKKQIIEKKK